MFLLSTWQSIRKVSQHWGLHATELGLPENIFWILRSWESPMLKFLNLEKGFIKQLKYICERKRLEGNFPQIFTVVSFMYAESTDNLAFVLKSLTSQIFYSEHV